MFCVCAGQDVPLGNANCARLPAYLVLELSQPLPTTSTIIKKIGNYLFYRYLFLITWDKFYVFMNLSYVAELHNAGSNLHYR